MRHNGNGNTLTLYGRMCRRREQNALGKRYVAIIIIVRNNMQDNEWQLGRVGLSGLQFALKAGR